MMNAMRLFEHASIYWTISQCWRNPALGPKLTFGYVTKHLRAIQVESGSLTMRVLAKKLLDDIVQNAAPPNRPASDK